jgi:alkaline phosphatase D
MNLRPGLTRRDLLRLAAVGAAGRGLWGCGDNARLRPPDGRHGVAIVEPSEDALLVSITALGARSAVVEIATGGQVINEVEVPLVEGRARLDLAGLAAGTAYEITVTTDDAARLGPHRALTAPAATDDRTVHLAVSGDVDPIDDFESSVIDRIVAMQPDLYVSLGDFPYTDDGPPATTLAAYRERHLALRTHPAIRKLFEAAAIRAIYDDHEFRNDWDQMFAAAEPERLVAALAAWDESFPLRGGASGVRYRSWRWGKHVECFLLDCRLFRSANAAPDDAGKTMLGEAQRAWLVAGVTQSTATWKLVFTSVPLDFGIGVDHWAGYTTEREQIFDALVGAPGVLFVSADQHYFAAHRHAHGIREFQVGPLRRGIGVAGRDAPGVLFRHLAYNFGWLEITGDRMTMRGIGEDGGAFYEESFAPADLTPV